MAIVHVDGGGRAGHVGRRRATHVGADAIARDWLLCVVEVPRARVGWAVGRCEVWDDDGRQLAIGSQAMYLSGVAGVPPTVDATGR